MVLGAWCVERDTWCVVPLRNQAGHRVGIDWRVKRRENTLTHAGSFKLGSAGTIGEYGGTTVVDFSRQTYYSSLRARLLQARVQFLFFFLLACFPLFNMEHADTRPLMWYVAGRLLLRLSHSSNKYIHAMTTSYAKVALIPALETFRAGSQSCSTEYLGYGSTISILLLPNKIRHTFPLLPSCWE